MPIKYTDCPTCGAKCRIVPSQKEIRIDALTDYDKDKIVEEAMRTIEALNILNANSSLTEFLDSISSDDLFKYLIRRIKGINPIRYSDLM